MNEELPANGEFGLYLKDGGKRLDKKMGIPALLGIPIFSWGRYAPVFEVEPVIPLHC